jgi:hypothetical protein
MALLALAECRWPLRAEPPKQLSQRITWCGRPPSRSADSTPPDTSLPEACIRIVSLEFPGAEAPFRMELREYRQPGFAFAAWRSLESPGHAGEGAARLGGDAARTGGGYLRAGSRWAFVHGAFLGLTDTSAANLYPEEFKDRLAIAGEPVFVLPPEFEAFPLRGRIPGSEGLFQRAFLGVPWNGPIFTVAYACHGDTALAFRGYPQNADSLAHAYSYWKGRNETSKDGESLGFIGEDEFGYPIILKIFPEGILGFSGCFDPQLSREYVEKMQKMRFFWHNP